MQQANQPFHYTSDDGVDHFVAKGDVFADKDDVLKGRAALFEALPDLDKKSSEAPKKTIIPARAKRVAAPKAPPKTAPKAAAKEPVAETTEAESVAAVDSDQK